MKKYLMLTLIAILACLTIGCGSKNYMAEMSKNLTQYEICVELDVENKSASCSQSVTYINNSDDILRQVKFHLYPQFFEEGAVDHVVSTTKLNNAYPNGVSYAEFEVVRVMVDGADVDVAYEGECDGILNVALASSLMPKDSVEISMEYGFVLPNCHHRFGYGDDTINLGNFYPIACVYENGEFNVNPYHPNGDPFYSEMANYTVNLLVDSDYIVASTGCKEVVGTKGEQTEYLMQENVVRDFAIVISDKFECVSANYKDTRIDYYFYNDSYHEQTLKAGVDAIKTFSMFGEYPYQRFSIVQSDFVHGGMEYPGIIYVSDEIKELNDYLNVVIHETAHQWWYAMVGNDEYVEPWLDEALTEYSTILFYDYNEGYTYNHSDMIKANKENYTLFVTVYKDVLGDLDTSMRGVCEYDTEPEYVYCTYVKGVLMFDSLYSLVGEKDFVNSLKLYFKSFAYRNAKADDLIKCFEDECDMELRSFFSSWIKGKVVVR